MRMFPTFPNRGARHPESPPMPQPHQQDAINPNAAQMDRGGAMAQGLHLFSTQAQAEMTPLVPLGTIPGHITCDDPKGFTKRAISFLADTGANITAIQLADLPNLGLPLTSIPQNARIPAHPKLADGSQGGMALLGVLKGQIMIGGKTVTSDIYVANHLAQPILQPTPPAKDMPSNMLGKAWADLASQYPQPLDGVCRPMADGTATICLKEGAIPYQCWSTRAIPINLQEAFYKELANQQAQGIIEEAHDINNPAEWLHPMVVTRKKDPSKCRITLDLPELNKATLQPRPTAALAGVPSSTYVRVVEDILVHTANPGQEHYQAVAQILSAATMHNIALNSDKVQFCQPLVQFAGFLPSHGCYRVDPTLTEDLRTFPHPNNRTELRSFLGLAQQLGYFTDEITQLTAPLCDLNTKHTAWTWTSHQEAAFQATRKTLGGPAYLTPFDPSRATELLTDAFKTHGLGFLLQQHCHDGHWRTVQCGSRTLASHEANWSGSAELKALAVAWAAHKCAFFLDGLPHFSVMTDSSPLVSILNDRRLDQVANDRHLKLKMALSRYCFTAHHQAGKRHQIADALSRAPQHPPEHNDMVLSPEDNSDREFVVAAAVASLSTPGGKFRPSNRRDQVVHIDLFTHGNQEYLLLTDEYSRWPNIYHLGHNTTSQAVIKHLRLYFLAHCVPTVVHLDNGPQLRSQEIRNFLTKWGVTCKSSSPLLPRTNGMAEAAVKAMKSIVRGATPLGSSNPDPDDLAEGIIAFRNQSRYGGTSPAEYGFGRRLREPLPVHPIASEPTNCSDLRTMEDRSRAHKTQGHLHDDGTAQRHPALKKGDMVWIQNQASKQWLVPGKIEEKLPHCDFMVRHEGGRMLWRNRVLPRRQPDDRSFGGDKGRSPKPSPHPENSTRPPPTQSPHDEENGGKQGAEDPHTRPTRHRKPNPRVTGPTWTC
eukprot:TCALIF_12746-PA protein Name:"Similar to Tf2-11 Transposon Tf2-11 polyprotein (Schizosaccharomyces pombe (strain 972 / ATCC 24843))" AED:0.29 eAED:0.29 QI:0/0/0/1/0.25/0.2/5/0/935